LIRTTCCRRPITGPSRHMLAVCPRRTQHRLLPLRPQSASAHNPSHSNSHHRSSSSSSNDREPGQPHGRFHRKSTPNRCESTRIIVAVQLTPPSLQTSAAQVAWIQSLRGSPVRAAAVASPPRSRSAGSRHEVQPVSRVAVSPTSSRASDGDDPEALARLTMADDSGGTSRSGSESDGSALMAVESDSAPPPPPPPPRSPHARFAASVASPPKRASSRQQPQAAGSESVPLGFEPVARPLATADDGVVVLGPTRDHMEVSTQGLLQAVAQLPRGEHYSRYADRVCMNPVTELTVCEQAS
jgi:hypothetical protein